MRAPWIFHLGLAVDGIILVAAAGNLLVMQFAFSDAMPAEGLTGIGYAALWLIPLALIDRKSTRLNSSHSQQSRMPSSA